jgi:hypothetical protein
MIDILLAGAMAWQFQTARDPLGMPVYVAEIAPDEMRSLRFLCGGVTGVVLQFNLGETEHPAEAYSADEPKDEEVRFTLLGVDYDTLAKRAPLTDGLGTYEIKGSEAAFVAGLFKDSDAVTVKRGQVSFQFSLIGAGGAIAEAMDACPFKYPDL